MVYRLVYEVIKVLLLIEWVIMLVRERYTKADSSKMVLVVDNYLRPWLFMYISL